MHITHEMNKHNCQLCKKEFLGRCFGERFGTDVSVDNEPCDGYEFGGSEKRLREIERNNEQEQIKREICHVGIYPCCIEFENGKAIRNCYLCIEKYGYAKGVYKENQKIIKILEEFEELKKTAEKMRNYTLYKACEMAIDIINQKLAELELTK